MAALTVVPTVPAEATDPTTARVTTRRVVRAEWIKFISVRSNLVTLAAVAVAVVLLGALFASLAGSGSDFGPDGSSTDPLGLSLSGFSLAQLAVGVLGVLAAASEYSSGLIRSTFSAVTGRTTVVAAKAVVVGAAALVTGTVTAVVAFLAGSATYAGSAALPALGDADVLRSVGGLGVYLAGIAVIGVALGFLFRSTAGAVGVLVASLLIIPGLAGLLPGSVGDTLARILPSSAGAAFSNAAISMGGGSDLLSAPAGLAVFGLWVAGLATVAAVTVRRRDA